MTDTLTHAITVQQPLAWAVAAGHCPVLMSDTRPPMEREGQLIGIHASQTMLRESERARYFGWPITSSGRGPVVWPAAYTRGALIGVARLVGVVRSRWHTVAGMYDMMRGEAVSVPLERSTEDRIHPWWRSSSKWGLLLTDAVLLPEPIPMRGAGGVWRLPFDRAAPEEGGRRTGL